MCCRDVLRTIVVLIVAMGVSGTLIPACLRSSRAAAFALALASATDTTESQQPSPVTHPDIQLFSTAIAEDDDQAEAALDLIAESWRDGYAGIIWDLLRFMEPPRRPRFQAPDFGDPADPKPTATLGQLPGAGAPDDEALAPADGIP